MQEFMVMLLLLGASVETDPKAPGPDQVTKYAMADADHMVFLNLRSIIPPTIKAVRDLANHPILNDIPKMDESVRGMMTQLEMGISMVKGRFGIHPVEDLHWAAGYVRYSSESRPEMLFVVRGKFGPATVEAIAKVVDQELERLEGRPLIVSEGMALGLTKDGAAIFGSEALVRERVGNRYKPVKAKKGSAVAGAKKHLKSKPFMLVSAAPSAEATHLFTRSLRNGPPMMGLIRDLVMSHKQAVVAIGTTSLAWEWVSPTKEGAQRVELASNGMVELMRAGTHAVRGFGRLGIAALDSFKAEPIVAAVLKHKKFFLKLVDRIAGSGKFTSSVKRQGRVVKVVNKGDGLAGLAPFAALVPVGGMVAWFGVSEPAPSRVAPGQPEEGVEDDGAPAGSPPPSMDVDPERPRIRPNVQ